MGQLLGRAHAAIQEEETARLTNAYAAALQHGKNLIDNSIQQLLAQIGRASFLQAAGDPHVRVKVAPSKGLGARVKVAYDVLEAYRNDAESKYIDQAVAEADALPRLANSFLVEEIKSQINAALTARRRK